MNKKYNILIIEPSFIIQEGLASVIKSINNLDFCISKIDSLNHCFKSDNEKEFNIVLVNPVLFNNFQNPLTKLSNHFSNAVFIGIISSVYDRNFCSNLSDCIYINVETHYLRLFTV